MSLWIEKLPDDTLLVPISVNTDEIKGDGVIKIPKNSPDYDKYLKLYEDEQQRLKEIK